MRKSLSGLLALLFLLTILSPAYAAPHAAGRPAPVLSASEVFALINEYRAANGLYALQQDSTLMQLAQAHSDYQASIGQITHGGPGGSRPKDRAYAAGYGDGQIIFISELITGGFEQDSKGALTWWKNSPEHNSYLLSDNYVELGIGVATDGNDRYYYTAELGRIASGTTYVPESGSENAAPITPQPIMVPVVRAERRDNGALVHIVREGQALWTIAAVYEVPLERLYELNNLNANSFIFPGDEIIIDPAPPPTDTPTPAPPTDTPSPSATATPPELAAAVTSTSSPAAAAQNDSSPPDPAAVENATVRLVVVIALVSIIAVIVASFLIQRPQPFDPDEDDPFAPLE